MTKVKVRDYKIEILESHLDYPIFLHYQDEDCNDSYSKVTESKTITVKGTGNGYEIVISGNTVSSTDLNNLCKKEHFDNFLFECIQYINDISQCDS